MGRVRKSEARRATPGLRYKCLSTRAKSSFIDPQIDLHLKFMESELGKSTRFAGNAFTAADVQMSFPLEGAASEDAPGALLVVPSRAPLPPGVPNYVTARGLALLRAGLAGLQAERGRIDTDASADAEQTRRLTIINARLADLAARLASAQLVDPKTQTHDEVRFGATVTVRTRLGEAPSEDRRFTIVGVDEAAPAEGRVAVLSPIARAVLGLRVGETAVLQTAAGEEELEVAAISYAVD